MIAAARLHSSHWVPMQSRYGVEGRKDFLQPDLEESQCTERFALLLVQRQRPEHFGGLQLQETVARVLVDILTATECRDIELDSVVSSSGISTADAASDETRQN